MAETARSFLQVTPWAAWQTTLSWLLCCVHGQQCQNNHTHTNHELPHRHIRHWKSEVLQLLIFVSLLKIDLGSRHDFKNIDFFLQLILIIELKQLTVICVPNLRFLWVRWIFRSTGVTHLQSSSHFLGSTFEVAIHRSIFVEQEQLSLEQVVISWCCFLKKWKHLEMNL